MSKYHQTSYVVYELFIVLWDIWCSWNYCFWSWIIPKTILTYLITYLLTYLLTHSTEQNPSWKANRFSASQEIPRILWNPKVHYLIHKCRPPVPTQNQIDPVHTPHPTSWRSILILSSLLRLGLPSGLLPSGFPTTNLYTPLLSPISATWFLRP
jgi:hypothetical protein